MKKLRYPMDVQSPPLYNPVFKILKNTMLSSKQILLPLIGLVREMQVWYARSSIWIALWQVGWYQEENPVNKASNAS